MPFKMRSSDLTNPSQQLQQNNEIKGTMKVVSFMATSRKLVFVFEYNLSTHQRSSCSVAASQEDSFPLALLLLLQLAPQPPLVWVIFLNISHITHNLHVPQPPLLEQSFLEQEVQRLPVEHHP
jgi:hypothetical protein